MVAVSYFYLLRTYQELARLRAHGISSFSILALAFYLAKISITNAIPPKSRVQICGCAVAKVPLLARPLLFSDITVPENRSCVSPHPVLGNRPKTCFSMMRMTQVAYTILLLAAKDVQHGS